MPELKLSRADFDLLREACRIGEVRVKVAGKISAADRERELERHKSATVLRLAGFLEELPDEGAYYRWRPVKGCAEALKAVLAERRKA